MTDKQSVDALLAMERDICGRIHSAITEILRKGYENGGKEQIESTIDSIRYAVDQMETIIDRRG
mgnify:CR=1 FL=1